MSTPINSAAVAAYTLGLRLADKLRLELEPFQHLPLAVWQDSSGQALYAFPSATTGRWLCAQRSTEASLYLAHWLTTTRSDLLTETDMRMLQRLQFSQAMLRALKPSLPDRAQLEEACSRVRHTRVPLVDGWIDTQTLTFTPLPYPPQLFVLQPVLRYAYKELMSVPQETLAQALGLLSEYLPVDGERDYFLRYIGRSLGSSDGHKVILALTDSLATTPGNSAKSTLLNWVQSTMTPAYCTLESAQLLTVGKSHRLMDRCQGAEPPALKLFDELASGSLAAQQLDCGQLKFLSSGRRNQPAFLLAAKTGDWPNLHALEKADPAFVRRLVLLPARARFQDGPGHSEQGACEFDIHSKLQQLSPALARLLLDEFLAYKRTGNNLLPIPASMHAFKKEVMVFTALGKSEHRCYDITSFGLQRCGHCSLSQG